MDTKTTHGSSTTVAGTAAPEIVNNIKQLISEVRTLLHDSNRWPTAKPVFGKVDSMFTQFFASPTTELRTGIEEQIALLRTECQNSNQWEKINPVFLKLDGALPNYFTSVLGG